MRLLLRAHPQAVETVRGVLEHLASRCPCARATLEDAKLAVSEACSNVVRHAYRTAGAPGSLEVTARLVPGGMDVTVADQGSGIRPRAPLRGEGLGMGLPLMAALARRLEIRRRGARTEVLMCFRDPSPAAPRPGPHAATDPCRPRERPPGSAGRRAAHHRAESPTSA